MVLDWQIFLQDNSNVYTRTVNGQKIPVDIHDIFDFSRFKLEQEMGLTPEESASCEHLCMGFSKGFELSFDAQFNHLARVPDAISLQTVMHRLFEKERAWLESKNRAIPQYEHQVVGARAIPATVDSLVSLLEAQDTPNPPKDAYYRIPLQVNPKTGFIG